MTIHLKPDEPIRPPVNAVSALAPDQNALLVEGMRVASLFLEGHLQEMNFKEVGVLMTELCTMAYNGVDSITTITHFMATNEQKAWRNFLRHLDRLRTQVAHEAAQTPKIEVAP